MYLFRYLSERNSNFSRPVLTCSNQGRYIGLSLNILVQIQGRRNGSQSGGAMEQWKILSATMVGGQEKFLNSKRSRMAKTVTFSPFVSVFSFCYAKKWGGGRGSGMAPGSPGVAGLEINNENTRTMVEICSKLTIKIVTTEMTSF